LSSGKTINIKMKKLVFLFSFLLVAGMATAQTKACSKAGKKCCAKKAKTESTTSVGTPTQVASAMAVSEADAMAESDENIEKRVCEKSGATSYYQKAVCEKSGKVSWGEVSFCSKSKAFKTVETADASSVQSDIRERSAEAVDGAEGKAKKACSKKCTKTCTKKKGA